MSKNLGKELLKLMKNKSGIVYRTTDEAKEILELVEMSSNYIWASGSKPTEFTPEMEDGYIRIKTDPTGDTKIVFDAPQSSFIYIRKTEFSNFKENYEEDNHVD